MTADGRFLAETVQTLSKRSALLCSNPDCGALTSGPSEEANNSINIGEAAHIYGRTTASARYNADLSGAEVSDITNGIWLCRNCHKLIDNDPRRFPAELLFDWRRQHEKAVLERLGRPGDKLRERLQAEHLRLFEGTSRLAQQIVLDRPPLWEYKLIAELLRTGLGSVHQRVQQLRQGLYVRKATIIPSDQLSTWLTARLNDLTRNIESVKTLMEELNKSCGPLGQSGSDVYILTTCNFIVRAAENLLEWEEDVRFLHADEDFGEVISSLRGVGEHQLDQLLVIPNELFKILGMENPEGMHKINLVFAMPDSFEEKFFPAVERARKMG